MSKKREDAICVNGKQYSNCFAFRDGKCDCMTDTDFKGGICPFYKTKEQAQQDSAYALGQLLMQGRLDLVRKYGSHRFIDEGDDGNAGYDSN